MDLYAPLFQTDQLAMRDCSVLLMSWHGWEVEGAAVLWLWMEDEKQAQQHVLSLYFFLCLYLSLSLSVF